MIERPTPETDAEAASHVGTSPISPGRYCHVDFVRELERARDDARADRECWHANAVALQKAYNKLDKALREQDKAREAFNNAALERDKLESQNGIFRNAQKACEYCDSITVAEVKELRRERDELREEVARLKASRYEDGRRTDGTYRCPVDP